MIVTAPAVATKICRPSVFTVSGSSTPSTWTLVPVYDGVDAELAEEEDASDTEDDDIVAITVVTPFPPKLVRIKVLLRTFFAFAATKSSSACNF